MAFGQKLFILENLHGRSVSLDLAIVNNNGAFAEVEHHVQIMGSNNFGMFEVD